MAGFRSECLKAHFDYFRHKMGINVKKSKKKNPVILYRLWNWLDNIHLMILKWTIEKKNWTLKNKIYDDGNRVNV